MKQPIKNSCLEETRYWWKKSGYPVEVGSLSHDLQGVLYVLYESQWVQDFFHDSNSMQLNPRTRLPSDYCTIFAWFFL